MRHAGLFQEIHRIASRYHWSETEILALPWARRRRYLAMIDADSAESLFDDLGGG